MKILIKITLSLLILIAVLAISDYFIGDESFIQDYIRGTITETIGIILTIILIELILGENRKNENKEKAKKGLIRSTNIIEIYLNNYNDSAFDLSYKYSDYDSQREIGLNENFSFNNLSELFFRSTSLFDPIGSTKVSKYFNRLDDLKEIIKTTLFQTDFTDFPELSTLLVNYLKEVERFYPKEGILSDAKLTSEKMKLTTFIKELLENHKGEVKYLENNTINKYVRLYELIKFHIDFNKQYLELIGKYTK